MAQDPLNNDHDNLDAKNDEKLTEVEFYFDGKKLNKQDHIALFEYMGDASQEASSLLKNFIYQESNEKQGLMAQPLNKWLLDDKLHSKEPNAKNLSNYDFGARARIPIIFGNSKYVSNRFESFQYKNEMKSLCSLVEYNSDIYLLLDDTNKPSKIQLKDKALIIHGNSKFDIIETTTKWIQNMKKQISEKQTVIHIEKCLPPSGSQQS